MTEPLLTENQSRHVLFPVQYDDIYRMYKLAASAYWLPDEINFENDIADLQKLTDNERYFIKQIIAFFAASDGIVMENLSMRFSNEIKIPEARAFYAFQNAIEAVHSETYSLLIDTYEKDPVERARLFNAVDTCPAIGEKAQWALRWIEDRDAPFSQRLIAFAIVEGLFFSASFCSIFWLRERNLMHGLVFANQLISRDESMHAEFAALLYSKVVKRLPQDIVHKMFREAVDIEYKFITEAIPCSMIGMNVDLMKQYIEYVADRMLLMLGYEKIFEAQNPFRFMEFSALDSKASFFEMRNDSYSRAAVSLKPGQSAIPTQLKVNLADEDF